MRNVLCIIIVLAPLPCCARTITVATDAPADFNNIQAAIIDANNGDTVEIRPGTYTDHGNTNIDFLGKPITVRSTDPTDPETVAQTIIDCNSSGRAFLFQTNEDPNSILEGVTIINGYSSGYGGAIYCTQSAPTIKNCTMTKNTAGSGGAIHCHAAGSAALEDCLFTNNSASMGGAIYCPESNITISNSTFSNNFSTYNSAGAIRADRAVLTINDCTFQDNSTHTSGGAITASDCQLTINGSRFIGNVALYGRSYWLGGAMYLYTSTATISKTLFAGNSAVQAGAIICAETDITIANCTFADNHANEASTLGTFRPLYGLPSDIHIENSIIWDGTNSIGLEDDSTLLVTFCDIPGVWPGYGNIDANPCFVNPGYWDPNGTPEDANDDFFVPGDYHLKSQAGRWDANAGEWTIDEVTSPCIDTADPNSPLGQEPFSNGGRINMGVYGATAEASKSYFGNPPCETIVAGDINGDCIVNSTDFALLSAHWLGRYYKTYPVPAKWPSPPDGQEDVSTNAYLGWWADCYPPYLPRPRGEIDPTSACAISHDVYFGTDYTALRYADRTSPLYKGNQPADRFLGNAYILDQLDANTTYYWRIDEIAANGAITTGRIWTFTTGTGSTR